MDSLNNQRTVNFHIYRKTLDLGHCGISTSTVANCEDSSCKEFRELLYVPEIQPPQLPFDPLHEDPTHFCGNTRSFELFPKSQCTCGNEGDSE